MTKTAKFVFFVATWKPICDDQTQSQDDGENMKIMGRSSKDKKIVEKILNVYFLLNLSRTLLGLARWYVH